MLREDSLKCSFYFHLRKKLLTILKENNLRIYSEYYFFDLKYRANIAIVQINPYGEKYYLKDMVADVVAIIELKYIGDGSKTTENWLKKDLTKIKNYIQKGRHSYQFYFADIYEVECSTLKWMDKRNSNNWAKGYVTELNAGYKEGKMVFEINSYNEMNSNFNY